MNLKNFRIRLGLASIRRIITSGNYSKGYQNAISLSRKFPGDERVLTLLADASLFSREVSVSEGNYNRVISLLDADTSLSKDNKRFLRAYISYRLLEVGFLQDNQKSVAKPHVVEDINSIPAGSSLRALFFIDAHHSNIPRPYGNRGAAKNILINQTVFRHLLRFHISPTIITVSAKTGFALPVPLLDLVLNLSRLDQGLFVTTKLAFKRLAVLIIGKAMAVGSLLKIREVGK